MNLVKDESKLSTRFKILYAAKKVFIENGFSGTSMSDIAKTAEVNQSLIHHHFDTKEKLWSVVRDSLFDEYLSGIESELEANKKDMSDIISRIARMLSYRFEFIKNHPEVAKMMEWQSVNIGSKIKYSHFYAGEHSSARIRKIIKGAVEDIEAAQKAGIMRSDFSPIFLIITSVILTSGWFQGASRWYIECAEKEHEELGGDYLKFVEELIISRIKA